MCRGVKLFLVGSYFPRGIFALILSSSFNRKTHSLMGQESFVKVCQSLLAEHWRTFLISFFPSENPMRESVWVFHRWECTPRISFKMRTLWYCNWFVWPIFSVYDKKRFMNLSAAFFIYLFKFNSVTWQLWHCIKSCSLANASVIYQRLCFCLKA